MVLDAAGATHVSKSLQHWGAPLSPWPDIADEMFHRHYRPFSVEVFDRSVSTIFLKGLFCCLTGKIPEASGRMSVFLWKPPGSMLKEDLH